MTPAFVVADADELANKVAALRRPQSYPEQPAAIEAIETHMSWVFRTGRCAYKLKKPIRSSFLDFSTLAARRHNCEEEVRLNRRLAPQVYLGVVPLTREQDGNLRVNGSGAVIDWLVHMRRLPDARALSRLIETGALNDGTLAGSVEQAPLQAAAHLLAHFYAHAPAVRLDAGQSVDGIVADLEQAWSALACARYALPREPLARLTDVQRTVTARLRPLIAHRVTIGRIIEGHGDLRPEHVFLLDSGPVVIDCIEFNRAFRILDPADDLALLALECERLGFTRARAFLFATYRAVSGDDPPEALLHFYQSYRAAVRAKLAVWHLDEPRYRDGGRWRDRAMHYVALAQAHASQAH